MSKARPFDRDGRNNIKGSKAADDWKYDHKHRLPKTFIACDADLVLLARDPFGVVAITDFKDKRTDQSTEHLMYTHVNLYQSFRDVGFRVFIVCANQNGGAWSDIDIYEFLEGNPYPNPPRYKVQSVLLGGTYDDYIDWEKKTREQYQVNPINPVLAKLKAQETEIRILRNREAKYQISEAEYQAKIKTMKDREAEYQAQISQLEYGLRIERHQAYLESSPEQLSLLGGMDKS